MNTKFTNEFSQEIFDINYSFNNETIDGMHHRIASYLAGPEEDKDYYTKKFEYVLKDFCFVPGGRIMSNAGRTKTETTMINCFVSGFRGKDQDSMLSILDELKRQALILKSEGGYGFNVDALRPKGTYIAGIGNESPGAVEMLDMWDTQAKVITKGSGKFSTKKDAKKKIRKGAQMVTLSVYHPDIEEYITAKQTSGRLTKFNMSVLVSDDFMKAVKTNKPWTLIYPKLHADELTKEEIKSLSELYPNMTIKDLYKEYWDGNYKKWKELNLPFNEYKTFKNANELWDLLMLSTYNRNEPGILFYDTINKLNNLYYMEHISATNPCGEQLLPVGGSCLLGSINVTQFINKDLTDWNYDKLKEYIPYIVRLMDNVNDLTYVPLEEQRVQLLQKRRIGLGIMGFGSSLMMMKIRYGSKKSVKITKKLMKYIANEAYKASALLAKEKGHFEAFDKEKYLQSNFIKLLDDDTKELIAKYGTRNSHNISIQPTGNSSILANLVSGGLEPIFMPEYIRTSIIDNIPPDINFPKNINWDESSNYDDWEWIKEGDDNLLTRMFNDIKYKIDKSRGLTKETLIVDYGVQVLKDKNEWDKNAEWAATTTELSVKEHLDVMKVFAKYVDSAISKTINLPSDYSFEDFKSVYINAYETGTIKGATTYRDGTMSSVLKSKDSKDEKNTDLFDENGRPKYLMTNQAPKRPEILECNVHNLTAIGTEWTVFIGLMPNINGVLKPFEVFAFKKKNLSLSNKIKKGKMIKVKSSHYKFVAENDLFELDNIVDLFERDEQEALTRSISGELRHGMDIKFVVQQLNKSEGTIVSFSKAVARTLNKYVKVEKVKGMSCPDCGKDVVNEEGCYKCYSCGWSKCL